MAEYYFNLPSLDTENITNTGQQINPIQKTAIQAIEAIAMNGGPGTGKSVVSIYRHLNLIMQGKNSQLLTFTKTLALYLAECCRLKSDLAAKNVCTTFKWINRPNSRDEIIVDEAQDLKFVYRKPDGFLTWELSDSKGNLYKQVHVYKDIFKTKYPKVSYGADKSQMLRDGITEEELLEIFDSNQPFRFRKNYRNTKKILRLAFTIFPDANISENDINECRREGERPVLIINNEDILKQDEYILELISSWTNEGHNIAILCPWQEEVRHFFRLIQKDFPDSSFFISDREGLERINNIHVTTFKSAKGLEFDTVILPNFHRAFENFEKYHLSWKDFYVGITRAKNNLYLISDRALPEIVEYVTILNDESEVHPDLSMPEEDDLPF